MRSQPDINNIIFQIFIDYLLKDVYIREIQKNNHLLLIMIVVRCFIMKGLLEHCYICIYYY